MTRRWLLAAALLLGPAAVACADLFHGFDDLKNACGSQSPCTDGDAPAPVEGGPPGDAEAGPTATDFCATGRPEAERRAAHACAWVTACESPFGENRFGACMLRARQAFDCTVRPTHPVRGALYAYWDRLWQAKSCDDVRAVTRLGANLQACDPGSNNKYTSCLDTPTGGSDPLTGLANVRGECLAAGAAPSAQRCLVSGQTCTRISATSVCTGLERDKCTATRCSADGKRVHLCDDAGLDQGRECTLFGAGACAQLRGDPPGCRGSLGVECTGGAAVVCDGNVAVRCTGGQQERLDCAGALPGARCRPAGSAQPLADLVAACFIPFASDASLPVDRCQDGTIIGVAMGATFSTKCADEGLPTCRTVTTADGTTAACSPP